MSILDFFKKNKDYLKNSSEKEAAQILLDIIHGFKIDDPDFMPDGVNKLSVGLYYLAFKRTNIRPFDLSTATDIGVMMSNPKSIEYVAVYKMIKDSIENVCQDPSVLERRVSIQDAEETILLVLKRTVESLKEI